MRFLRLALSLWLASAALGPSLADAQRPRRVGRDEAEGEAEEARARGHFETGVSLYQNGNYEGAVVEFEESYRIRPVPVVLFNLAQTYRRLYRYDEAIDAYRRYLRTAEGLAAEDVRAVRTTIAELERGMAPVTIDTDVPGAEIRIDGRSVGRTPLDGPLRLAAGTRRIEAVREGYVTVREDLEVIGGESQVLSIRLPPEDDAATLRVMTNVDEAMVRIDGIRVGPAPVERRLGAGGHEVEVSATGYETYLRELVLAAGQDRDIVAELSTTRGLTEQWWFWAAIGGGVVAVTLAIVIGVVAASGQGQAVEGTLGTVYALTLP